MDKLTAIVKSFIVFINGTLVPLVFAIAFIVFIWGVYKYFIQGGASEEKRKEGRQFIMYGLIGFFVMVSVWGLVNLLVGTFNFDSNGRPCLPTFGKDNNCSNSTGSTGTLNNTSTGTSGTSGTVTCLFPTGDQAQLTADQCRSESGVVYTP